MSIISRFLQGIGSAVSFTLVYSHAASLCDESNLKATMGYMELAYSIGVTVGPIFGSFLYYINGYSFPFYISGFLSLITIIFIRYLSIDEEEHKHPEFLKILTDRDISLTFLAIIIDLIVCSYFYPMLSHHLITQFGLSMEVTSFFFVIPLFTYFLSLKFLNHFTNKINPKIIIAGGLLINFFGVIMLPPVNIFLQ